MSRKTKPPELKHVCLNCRWCLPFSVTPSEPNARCDAEAGMLVPAFRWYCDKWTQLQKSDARKWVQYWKRKCSDLSRVARDLP